MGLKELFEKRLLVKIPIDKNKIVGSIKTSDIKIEEAKKLFQDEYFNQVIVSAYTSMFHAARAMLYKDGVQEKSHYAVYFYLTEKYRDEISKSLLISFDNYREQRHNALYGFEYHAKEEEAENIIKDAEDFLDKIKEILN
ncbi:MAG: HEPN domain-containing protein [Nanoarchaeota archaeon]|nr:HEPN domain-containing protein [Nanoarchaeota archaeon]